MDYFKQQMEANKVFEAENLNPEDNYDITIRKRDFSSILGLVNEEFRAARKNKLTTTDVRVFMKDVHKKSWDVADAILRNLHEKRLVPSQKGYYVLRGVKAELLNQQDVERVFACYQHTFQEFGILGLNELFFDRDKIKEFFLQLNNRLEILYGITYHEEVYTFTVSPLTVLNYLFNSMKKFGAVTPIRGESNNRMVLSLCNQFYSRMLKCREMQLTDIVYKDAAGVDKRLTTEVYEDLPEDFYHTRLAYIDTYIKLNQECVLCQPQ